MLTVALGARLAAEARPAVLPGIIWWGSPLGETWRRWLHPGIVTAPDRRAADRDCRLGGRRRSGRRSGRLSPAILRDEIGERTPQRPAVQLQ